MALAMGSLGSACSSSDASSPPAVADAGEGGADAAAGTSSGGADTASAGASGADAAGADPGGATSGGASAAGGSGGSVTAGPGQAVCEYALSGQIEDPTTLAPYGCGNSHIEQPNGQGDYTASIGAGFVDGSGNLVSMACTLDSATPPSAGAVWTLSVDTHSQGNCQFNSNKNGVATLWAATGNDGGVTGSLKMTFTSATMTHGTAHPADVYYLFDVQLVATVKGLTARATDVTITGRFQNNGILSGS